MIIELTTVLLAVVLAAHLFHHRIAMRHISYVEVVGAAVLAIPSGWLPDWVLIGAHLVLTTIFILGSLDIDRLSPSLTQSADGGL